MTHLLCRKYVDNVDHWREVFRSHDGTRRAAGLRVLHLWRDLDKADQFFLLFEVDDLDRARTYLENPRTLEVEDLAGVRNSEYWFLEEGVEIPDLSHGSSPAIE